MEKQKIDNKYLLEKQLETLKLFLERNLITVALSDAVVVAQADIKSGSMSSARAAIKFGIPLYVLPQRLGESSGTNELLASQKAKIITDFDKFAMEFGVKNYKKKSTNLVLFLFCSNY